MSMNFFMNNTNTMADKDILVVPSSQVQHLLQSSDYFGAVYGDEPTTKDLVLTREDLGLKPEVFRWVPWIFNYIGVKVEDPTGVPHSMSEIIHVRTREILRFLVDYFGFSEDNVLSLYQGLNPRVSKPYRGPTRRNSYNSNKSNNYNSNRRKNKATRRANKKSAERGNIRGLHLLEAKYI
jgi:hypothetical protein